ncbi:hypothetical protein C9E85_16225 [Plesiomonas shigelloides]|uniref:hypothetical protein n=1 Tax=Plesiomonas shigelloides TaxID=703 RepID=UPI000D570049|nr:hypothetical protein [Plesiomonas shigelloides]PVU64819.1 hypothetical protein C9E85_16225 [Plesiomonas shigelloides]
MEQIISKSFDEMVATYTRTLANFYPARGSTGFTEANQVHIYVNALVKYLDDDRVVSWLEFPWADKKQHIDGFIFSPKHKSVFFIEAKRLSHTKKKQEIINDITRLHHQDKTFLQDNGVYDYENEYVIALSDVWLETKWKRSIPEWWCGLDKVPEQVLAHGLLITPDSTIHDSLAVLNWNQSTSFAYWMGEHCENVKNYCLLMAASRI